MVEQIAAPVVVENPRIAPVKRAPEYPLDNVTRRLTLQTRSFHRGPSFRYSVVFEPSANA
jgi:hypothetical protein